MLRRQVFALAFGALGACGRRGKDIVRVAAVPYLSTAPLYQALEQGYFAAEGLQIEIQQIIKPTQAIPLLAGGKLDVGFYGVSASFLNAVARGARVRIAAGRQHYSDRCSDGQTLLGSRKAFPHGFESLRQLKGKRVALHDAEIGPSFRLDTALAAAGLTRDDITLVIIPENEGAAMAAEGKIDVIIALRELSQFTALRDHVVRGPSYASFLPGHMNAFITFGQRFLDAEPASGIRFLRAYFRGARDFVAGREPRFFEQVARQTGLDPALARQACRGNFVLDGHISRESIQQLIDYAVRRRVLANPMKADQLVDMRFIDALGAATAA